MIVTLALKPEVEERLRLHAKSQGLLLEDYMEAVLERAAAESGNVPKSYSLLDLEGVGAELWQGIDAQEYIDQMRDEWEKRS